MRRVSDCTNVGHVAFRISYGFAVNEFGFLSNGLFNIVRRKIFDECDIDAEPWQSIKEKRLSPAVKRSGTYDMVAGPGDICDCQEYSGHPAGCSERPGTAFQFGDTFFQ